MEQKREMGLKQRWNEFQPTKTSVFWSWVASVGLIMLIGFNWAGWVTGGTAQSMAQQSAEDAVVKRLAPICVTQFGQGSGKEQKLKALKETDSWQRGEYVEKQGWATMPGEQKADRKVAEACAMLLLPS
ncbi:MAG: hypothetical protein HY712_07390 [candidate division NC10 bacterium]|nr:hypothetical protein [candidate division NC10 bacterium]